MLPESGVRWTPTWFAVSDTRIIITQLEGQPERLTRIVERLFRQCAQALSSTFGIAPRSTEQFVLFQNVLTTPLFRCDGFFSPPVDQRSCSARVLLRSQVDRSVYSLAVTPLTIANDPYVRGTGWLRPDNGTCRCQMRFRQLQLGADHHPAILRDRYFFGLGIFVLLCH